MIFRRATSPNWYTILYVGGRQRWISLRTSLRREAEARAARLRYANLPDVIRAVAAPPPMPLADLWEEYARHADLKPQTWESYHRIFDLFRRWARVRTADRVTVAVADQYLSSLRDKAPRTANLARGVLSSIWRSVHLADPWSQCRTRPRKTVPFRPLTDAEVRTILAEAAKVAPWWRPLILVAFYTGLRISDASMLRWSQFGPPPDLAWIELRPQKTAKSGRAVWIPVHPALREELTRLPRSSAHLFPEAVSKQTRRSLGPEFSRILDRAGEGGVKGEKGVSRVGYHSLRVTFSTRARRAGIPTDDLRAMLGHTTSAMTSHYIDAPDALRLDAYPPLDLSKPLATRPDIGQASSHLTATP